MLYKVYYVNPNRITDNGACVAEFRTLAQVRAFLKQNRQYRGSFQDEFVERTTAKGVTTHVDA